MKLITRAGVQKLANYSPAILIIGRRQRRPGVCIRLGSHHRRRARRTQHDHNGPSCDNITGGKTNCRGMGTEYETRTLQLRSPSSRWILGAAELDEKS